MAPTTAELLRIKRDGGRLSASDITHLVRGMGSGEVGDAQLGAFAMAVCLRGMDAAECLALTMAMRDSGERLTWSDPRPRIDKHSTGGVGDCTSLIVAPILAACGALVPMLSGRGLGHTGGTLDKLEAIPGYRCTPSRARLRRVLRDVGCAIVGADRSLAPADRRLYAVRDVTSTIDSIPLITASILAKKLAAGVQTLVLDVKTGSGAFMADSEAARALAASLLDTADRCGLRATVLLTDMDQPLASAAGNALEVAAALRVLTGEDRDSRLRTLSLALASHALRTSGLVHDPQEADRVALAALDGGAAAERLAAMVHGLGGPADLLEHGRSRLPAAPFTAPLFAPVAGFLTRIDTRALGFAVVGLGGGRRRIGDAVDPAVGLSDILPVGRRVDTQTPLMTVHARTETDWRAAAQRILGACTILPEAEPARARRPLIEAVLTAVESTHAACRAVDS